MIKGIHHISMKCNTDEEMSKVKDFYLSVLGLKIIREWPDGIMIDKVRAAGYEVIVEPNDKVIMSDPEYPIRMAFCFGPLGEQIEFFSER